jgi:dihydrolipoamide dehydrogenase
MSSFDVVIIGSGPGGYVEVWSLCTTRSQNSNYRKIFSSRWTCLNVGCIPSKALLASSHNYSEVAHFDHGIEVSGEVKVN